MQGVFTALQILKPGQTKQWQISLPTPSNLEIRRIPRVSSW